MEERVKELERRVSELSSAVQRLEARLAGQAPARPAEPAMEAGGADEPELPPLLPDTSAWAGSTSLFGRSLLVVGGAFLIRAITDKDLVPHGVGVALGVGWATVWIALAWLAAGKGRRLSATFHGVTAALVGFPLILETGTRLQILTANQAALALLAFTAALLVTAGRWTLRLVAWVGVLGSTVTVALVMRDTDSPLGLTAALVGLLAATLLLADLRQWTGPRWLVALFADLIVARRLFSAAAQPELSAQVAPALALAFVAVVASLAFVAWHTLGRRRPIGAFEVVQTALAVAVGVATSARVEAQLGWVPPLVGAVALALALGALVTCVKLSDRLGRAKDALPPAQGQPEEEHGFDVWFYGTAGVALILGGVPLITRGPLLAIVWGALALVAALLARRTHTAMLWAFGAVLAWAAGTFGGVLTLVRDGLLAKVDADWALVSADGAVVFALVLAAYLCMAVRAPASGSAARALPAALLALATLAVAGAVSYLVRGALGGAAADAGAVVLVRTLLLVAFALSLGGVRRLGGPVELGWIAWGTLGVAGLKMLGQDLPSGRASTLFIAFLALGAGVIVLPRLIRPSGAAPKSPDSNQVPR